MENVGQSAQISSSAMQRKAIIAKVKASRLASNIFCQVFSYNYKHKIYRLYKKKTKCFC